MIINIILITLAALLSLSLSFAAISFSLFLQKQADLIDTIKPLINTLNQQ